MIPLWENTEATNPNISAGVLEKLAGEYGQEVSPEDFFSYTYAVLFNPEYSAKFHEELGQERGVRLTITKNHALFQETAALGRYLIFLHSWGERMKPEPNATLPQGEAKCTRAIKESWPREHHYDGSAIAIDGGEFAPVAPEIWNFEVSGFKPIQHWVKTRLHKGTGRRSAPMDDIRPIWTSDTTDELLRLLWLMEHTIAKYPALNACLRRILDGSLFTKQELLAKGT